VDTTADMAKAALCEMFPSVPAESIEAVLVGCQDIDEAIATLLTQAPDPVTEPSAPEPAPDPSAPNPPDPAQACVPCASRIFRLYVEGGSEQRLRVYEGTYRDELIAGIRETCGFSPTQALSFLDSDGTPVVLSAALPDGVQLYVEKRTTAVERAEGAASEALPAIEDGFYWDPATNSSPETHELFAGNLSFRQTNNRRCAGVLMSRATEPQQSLLWTLHVDPLQCCVHAGVVTDGDEPEVVSCTEDTPKFFDLFRTDSGSGFFDAQGLKRAGFYLTSKVGGGKVLFIFCPDSRRLLAKGMLPEGSYRPAVFFKHEVTFTLTSCSTTRPPPFLAPRLTDGLVDIERLQLADGWVDCAPAPTLYIDNTFPRILRVMPPSDEAGAQEQQIFEVDADRTGKIAGIKFSLETRYRLGPRRTLELFRPGSAPLSDEALLVDLGFDAKRGDDVLHFRRATSPRPEYSEEAAKRARRG